MVMGSPRSVMTAPTPPPGRTRGASAAPRGDTSPSRSMSGKRRWWLDLGETVIQLVV